MDQATQRNPSAAPVAGGQGETTVVTGGQGETTVVAGRGAPATLVAAARTTMTAQTRPATRALRTALFQEATTIVRTELARPITFAELSRRVAISPRQLRRVFEECGGTNFRSFLAEERMGRAAELLATTELRVRDVARRVGYREPSRFTKTFKRAYGCTPSRFRADAASATDRTGRWS